MRGQIRLTTEQFVAKAKARFGDKYDYSKTEYKGYRTKVTITCPEHGDFHMLPHEHLKGHGCALCGRKNRRRGADSAKAVPVEEALRRLRKSHPHINLIVYNGMNSEVEMYCMRHQYRFYTSPKLLLKKQCCPLCSSRYRSEQFSKRRYVTFEEIKRRCVEVHGLEYEYDAHSYDKTSGKLRIKCSKHGWFWQRVSGHLKGSGCPECACVFGKAEEKIARLFADLPQERRWRGYGKEIDIWFPEQRVGIEYHGAYWHSERHRNKYAHAEKADLADRHQFRLFQIFDFEWEKKQEILLRLIKDALYGPARITGARVWTVRQITNAQARVFLEKHHLHGFAGGKPLALTRDDEISAVMTFRKKRDGLEIARFATTHYIKGGLEKLVAHVKRQTDAPIYSFVDRRFFTGASFRRCEFKLLRITQPNYWYVDKGGRVIGRRQQFQKHKLQALLGDNFDPSLTEAENMKRAGYYRLFDAGHKLFVLR